VYDGVSSTWARVLTPTALPSLFPGVPPYPQSPREIVVRVVSRVISHTNGCSLASHFSRVAFQCPSPANSISHGISSNYEGDGIQENDEFSSALRPHRVQHHVRVRSPVCVVELVTLVLSLFHSSFVPPATNCFGQFYLRTSMARSFQTALYDAALLGDQRLYIPQSHPLLQSPITPVC